MKGKKTPGTAKSVPKPAARRRSAAAAAPQSRDPLQRGEEWEGHGEGPVEEKGEADEQSAEPVDFCETERRIMELLQKQQDLCAPPPGKRTPAHSQKFRLLDHTADVGIQAYGETLCEAFENAALGMFNIITDPSKVGAQQDFEVTIEGEDLKALLHEWLDQLLILSQVNNMLFSSFRVDLKHLDGRMGLTGLAMGEPADPSRHVYKTEIKAVTHHMLEVKENPPMVKVLFDI